MILQLVENRFKEVNDTFGHHVGDLLLCEVGTRLKAVLSRESDSVARLGGDEFAVLLPLADSEMAENVAKKILLAFDEPMFFEQRRLQLGGSIGVATFPMHGDDSNLLMSSADSAMYRAKRQRLGFAIFKSS